MRRKTINILIAIIIFIILDNIIASIMKHGIDNYFGLDQHSEVLLIGHSHLMLSVDKQKMEQDLGLKISKYCREGVDVNEKYYMVKQYLESPYSDSLKVMLYGVDLFTFTEGGLSKNAYKLFYPFMGNNEISEMIKQNSDVSDYWSHKMLKTYRFNDFAIMNATIRGLRNDWSNKKSGTIDIEAYKQLLANNQERHIDMNDKLIDRFKQTIKLATDRGIRVVLVNPPTLDLLNNYERDKFEKICRWYETFASTEPLVDYWDFNTEYSTDHSIFYDRLHVNTQGQSIISNEILERIKALNL